MDLDITNSEIKNCEADGSGFGVGGGIYCEGKTVIDNSLISDCVAANGGAIYTTADSLVLKNNT